MDGSNKWCSRRDLGGNVGTKYQSVCSAPVWEAVCSTASTCRIIFYSSSGPLHKASSKSISNRLDSVWKQSNWRDRRSSSLQWHKWIVRIGERLCIILSRKHDGILA